ncbi:MULTISPECIES: hypothetical protein [Rhodococcus]|uniref:hypothetical protein n=1 Tax=Rhodococcus TaxID=1827 RepID=UPI002954D7B6|nr:MULTISPECIES: hypothetical protein [Rhodococcus]MDV7246241.1 hypothetical protein [Rhodococcus oxybenzonivorans]MDV7337287.1 hypothetical protein [Rhodococcus oxybenzonivorans]MDV8030725.1 hypothetical protein [Rhodococcus sp. IEGM 27]
MKKLIASAALLAGITSAGLVLAPTASAIDTEGLYNQCSGFHDGSTCWSQEHGVFEHLDLDGLEMGYKHN